MYAPLDLRLVISLSTVPDPSCAPFAQVLIESKNAGAVFQRNGCDERVNCAECYTFSSSSAVNRGRAAVGVKSLGSSMSHCARKRSITPASRFKTLQDLGDNDSSQSERLTLLNHPPQLSPSTSRRRTRERWTRERRTKKIDPDRAVDQDHTRFLREVFRSPCQMPLP